jgi:hypothetical protein
MVSRRSGGAASSSSPTMLARTCEVITDFCGSNSVGSWSGINTRTLRVARLTRRSIIGDCFAIDTS